jgi:hypothetical protein
VKLFDGLTGSDYQDTLRAIGSLIDGQGLRDIRIWEHEAGVIVQGRSRAEAEGAAFETFLLTDDDLKQILTGSYERRAVATG